MRHGAIARAMVAAALATTVAVYAHARRAGSASDGHPTSSGSFLPMQAGLVVNFGSAAANWTLPTIIDGSGSKSARVVATGNFTTGTECWGVAISATGSASVGAAQRGSSDCHEDSLVTTPNVTIASGGSFLVTCTLPARGSSCSPHITQYTYTQ